MKIRELLNSPETWTKGCTARDARGLTIAATDVEAAAWCLGGALIKCYEEDSERLELYGLMIDTLKINSLSVWNDAPERTFEEIQEFVRSLDV